jgi:protocatechuate 3,4-dioxygenase, alpha subunit
MMKRTPSQTIGPFFHEAMRWPDGGKVRFAEKGVGVVLTGRLLDGAGEAVADAMIETWQLGPDGKPPAPAAGDSRPHGFARVETDRDGTYRIETLMPGGAVPFIDMAIFARGLLKPLRTRVYLADENHVRAEPLLHSLAGSNRLHTLIARRVGEERGTQTYRWDVRLQGVGETVFFAS